MSRDSVHVTVKHPYRPRSNRSPCSLYFIYVFVKLHFSHAHKRSVLKFHQMVAQAADALLLEEAVYILHYL